MQPDTSQKKGRKEPLAEDPLDPYELVRRLSLIQAEETIKELDRRCTDWETELRESRGVRQTQIRNRTQTAPHVPTYKQHKRSVSLSLAPNHLPPPAYTDLPEPARKHSLPSLNRPQYSSSSRRPSLKSGDSGDLETINENAVVEPTMENLFPDWTESQRRRASALPRVNEDGSPEAVSTLWKPRRRSSLTSETEGRQQDSLHSDNQSMSRRRSSSSQARNEHRRQDWSQSDESPRPRSRRSSLLNKLEQYWKPGQVETSDGEGFDSKASTLRNSWRSSIGDSTTSRRPSLLKKIGDCWVVSPPSSVEQPNVKDIHTDEDSLVDSPVAMKRSSLFSKLRH